MIKKGDTMNSILKEKFKQIVIVICIILLLVLTFIPIFLMIVLSFKSNIQIYTNFWALPWPIQWGNYNIAIDLLMRNMINTIIVVSISTFGAVFLASLSGYTFARLDFPGKNVLFMMIISLMMVPSILTLTPLYKLIQTLNINNTWWALILPWISGGQVMGIILSTTFMKQQPKSLFEAARIDGAKELQAYLFIAVPLAKPILTTAAIMNMVGFYNDFIWPLVSIDSNLKQMISVAIRVFQSATGNIDIGSMVAGFVFATIPLLIMFAISSRFFIEGLTSGAVKS